MKEKLLQKPCEFFVSNVDHNTLVIICENYYCDVQYNDNISKDELIDKINQLIGNHITMFNTKIRICESLYLLIDCINELGTDVNSIDIYSFDEVEDDYDINDINFMKNIKLNSYQNNKYYINMMNVIEGNGYIDHIEGEAYGNGKSMGTFFIPSEILRDYIKQNGVNGWVLNTENFSTCNLLVDDSLFNLVEQYFVSSIDYSCSDISTRWKYINQNLIIDNQYLDNITYNPETKEYSYQGQLWKTLF